MIMSDRFQSHRVALDSPAKEVAKVTKDDLSDLPDGTCRSLLVGTAGTANIVDAQGNDLANVPLQQGYNPIRVARVKTGGAADDIWALY